MVDWFRGGLGEYVCDDYHCAGRADGDEDLPLFIGVFDGPGLVVMEEVRFFTNVRILIMPASIANREPRMTSPLGVSYMDAYIRGAVIAVAPAA